MWWLNGNAFAAALNSNLLINRYWRWWLPVNARNEMTQPLSDLPEPAVATSGRPGAPALAYVDGWGINLSNINDALSAIISAAAAKEAAAVFTLNLDHLVKLRTSSVFRSAYRKARYVAADGAPVVWLSALAKPQD